ncbi:MAG: hypothetical protein JKY65_28770 [Planctomycetes bacterium]|nr:hypothetical protein [Planctomycetota bacterium]
MPSTQLPLTAILVTLLALGDARAEGEDDRSGSPSEAAEQEEGAADLRQELRDVRERLRALEEVETPGDELAAGEDLDLSATLDQVLGRLRLSGYVLGGYTADRRTSTSLRPLLVDHHFFGSDASLYLSAELPADFHAMVQVIFLPRPQDNVYRVEEDIEIERAFVQWSPLALFQVRVGKVVTPVGFWNYLIHDEPLLPTLSIPLPIRRRIFPEEITGLVLEGEAHLGPARVGYAAWISNGESSASRRDDNHDKAVGGRLYLAADNLGILSRVRLGASAYTGLVERPKRFTPADPRLRDVALREGRPASYFEDVFEARGLTPWGEPIAGGRDRAGALDLLLDLGGLRLRAEVFVNWVRPRRSGTVRGARFRQWGAYAYLGYRLELPALGSGEGELELGVLEPFVRYDVYDGNTDFVHELQSLQLFAIGFRYELNEHVQFRTELTHHSYRERERDFSSVTSGVLLSF